MRSSLVMSLIGAASMAVALLAGCGDDDSKLRTSGAGQSCVRTSDCDSGLSCIANVCYQTAPSGAGEGGGTSTPLPTKGGTGESCNSRLDCAEGLGCFNNRCTKSADTGDAGSGNSGVTLGSRGETCRVNGDCDSDLVCVPSSNLAGTGTCDLKSFGLEPTGKSCTGECLEAADCCQLPIALHTLAIQSCKDIDDAITAGAIDCAAPATATASAYCFEQATYCGACKNVWSCDADRHACVYKPKCTVAAGMDAPGGCPSTTRLRNTFALTCNPTSLTCTGATAAAGCTSDAKCLGQPVFDSLGIDVCTEGECTCYAGNKQCYRICNRDIDCGAGLVCDNGKDGSNLCVPAPTCSTDTQCAVANSNLAWKCNEGTCAQACASDRDCSATGLNQQPFTGRVCGANGFCATINGTCDEATQCAPLTVGGLKPFCVDTAGVAAGGVKSAITE